MSINSKKVLTDINQPSLETLKIDFVSYLQEIEQHNLSEIAKIIDWTPFINLFEIEFTKLWNKLFVPKKLDRSEEMKEEFLTLVLSNVKPNLFHSAYLFLKAQTKAEKLTKENLDGLLINPSGPAMYELLKVFDYQLTLSSLNKDSSRKFVIGSKVESKKRTEPGDKFSSQNQVSEEESVFVMIDEELERRERIGQKWSIRAICDLYGKNELGYGQGGKKQSELDNFHKRYLIHQRKTKRR